MLKRISIVVVGLLFVMQGYVFAGPEPIKNGNFEKMTGFTGKTYGLKIKDLKDREPHWDKFLKIPHWNDTSTGNIIVSKTGNHYLKLISSISQYIDATPGLYQIRYKVSVDRNSSTSASMFVKVNGTTVDFINKTDLSSNFEFRVTDKFESQKTKKDLLEFVLSKNDVVGYNIDDIEIITAEQNDEEPTPEAPPVEEVTNVIRRNEPFTAKNIVFTPPWFVIYNNDNVASMLIDSNGNLFFPGVIDEAGGEMQEGNILKFSKENQSYNNLHVSQGGDIAVSGMIYQNTNVFPNKNNVVIIQNKKKETLAVLDPSSGDIYIKGYYELPEDQIESE